MSTITWLHLSDLHFSTQAGPAWDADVVLRSLIHDVEERIARDGLAPDLILVSGDIAYSGKPAEYALARAFFERLLAAAGLPAERLFLVPGNHDVDRGGIGMLAESIEEKVLTGREAANELLADPEACGPLLKRLRGYAAFTADLSASLTPAAEGAFDVRLVELAGVRIAVLGLNSAALAHGGDRDSKRLVLGERRVRAAVEQAAGADLRIALLHHPFDWLADFDREDCEALLTQDGAFVLQGHLHRTGLSIQRTPDAGTMVIAAGACFETRREHNGYNLVRLDLEAGRGAAHLRMYSDRRGGFWTRDVVTYRNVQDGTFEFPLPWQVRPTPGPRPAPPRRAVDLDQVEPRYRAHLAERYRFLEFKGMGVSDRVPLRLPLVDLYVPLKARIELPEGDTWSRELRLAGRPVSAEEAEAMGRRLSGPVPLLDLVRQHDGLVILGDPGSGKTTFLKYLALCLALESGDGEPGLGDCLPILVPLSAYANALARQDVPLDAFIAAYYRDRGLDLPLGPLFDRALGEGKALFLLDGLDEVRDQAHRLLVVSRITDFYVFHRQKGSKFVLTSRIVGYREVRPVAEGLAECTLVDFEDEEIDAFVAGWTAALERAARDDRALAAREAGRERDELLSAVRHSPGVRQLAANPLLLTILALMKRQGIALPERRVELYQKYVETLLKHWNLARGLDRPPGRDLDVVETLRVLAPLALWMHETSPGVGLVKRQALRRKLRAILAEREMPDPEQAAERFLGDVHDYAGLLLERGPGEYGFIHLTFQEYLAAVALAQRGQQAVEPVAEALASHIGDPNWHEVSLLAVGYLGIVQQRDEAAGELLLKLVEAAPGEPGQAAVLAGEAAADAWPGGVTPACKAAVVGALLATLGDDARVRAPLRAGAGRVLGQLGDPRFRPDAWFLPDEPLLGLIEIPAGPFRMGSDKRDREASDAERPQHMVDLPAYYIARYPVTVAQFGAFVQAAGYQAQGDWERYSGPANSPVVGVTWHDARAYCAWLNAQLGDWPGTPPALAARLRQGWQIRLPTEAEWEKAARGADGRRFPWGDEPDPNRANYDQTMIGAPSAVGCFPGGAGPCGALDMAGNVWEWTDSLWGKDWQEPDFKYPYRKDDGREDETAGDDVFRVLRGGSFDVSTRLARCAYRDWFSPFDWGRSYGFRLAVAPGFPSGL